jgi:uncharacterized LabA/DUF88 family protein
MKNVLLAVDTKSLFNSLHKLYGNGKLDYQKYVALITKEDHLFSSIAYGQQSENNSVNFITVLNKLGFVCKFKQLTKVSGRTVYSNNNVALAIDIVSTVLEGKIDRVVIGSNDIDLLDLITWVVSKGIPCDIVACGVPKVLADVASSVTELDQSILLG